MLRTFAPGSSPAFFLFRYPLRRTNPRTASLVKQAEATYEAKDNRRSTDLSRRAFPLVEELDRAGVEYSLACSEALAGINQRLSTRSRKQLSAGIWTAREPKRPRI